jgi:hypothetical protein
LRTAWILSGALMLTLQTTRIAAQDPTPPAESTPAFESNGSITAGYRFIDISGYKPKFDEQFGLRPGFRLHEFEVSGRATEGTGRIADSYQLTATGIGGEPFSSGQFRMSRAQKYDLRADFRQSYYYWNRNDEAIHPTGLHGLTTNHDWATVRKWGGTSFDFRATDKLKIDFEYRRNTRDGVNFTTRTLDYFGASSTFLSFVRANPYYVAAPLDQSTNRFTAGLSYALKDWNVFYRAGFQSYTEKVNISSVTSTSLNVDDPVTARETLTQASWSEFRRLRTPVSEFLYNGRTTRKLQLRGGYIYYRYTGPVNFDNSFSGTARTNSGGTTFGPYAITETVRNTVREPNHVIDQGFTYQVRDWWNIHTDYRYSRFTIEGNAHFNSVSNLTGTVEGEEDRTWRYGLHIADIAMEFMPARRLIVRPGIRLMKRDVTVTADGVADPQASKRSKIVAPIGSIYYSPTDRVSLRIDVQSITNGSPYTRITPRTDITSRFVGKFDVTEKLSIENAYLLRNGKYATTEFENSYRSNGTTVNYRFSDRYSAFGGFTYDSFTATAAVNFLRGTQPLNATWRDQTVNRIWQGGIDARFSDNFDIQLNGNFVRTTGVGEISGELPVYGPLKWPIAMGTVSYRFPKAGRLSLDLQRTYYIEEIVTGNNYSANILGIRWTKDF